MHEFSALDGFADITECMAEMIKYIANEPSVGLFYVQQHTHNAVPNVVRLRNKVADKSQETTLHTEDSEDSIAMVRSMKECGSPIADEMIRDIKKTLAVMSSKQPRRGALIQGSKSSLLMERASSWGPTNWGRPGVYGQRDGEKSGYFSSVFKSAKKKTSDFKWAPFDSSEIAQTECYGSPIPNLNRSSSVASSSSKGADSDEVPLSCQINDGPEVKQEDESEDESSSSSFRNLIPERENFDEFKAEREAKLEKWLEEHGDQDDHKTAGDPREI